MAAMRALIFGLSVLLSSVCGSGGAAAEMLPIPPKFQQTPVWCWATVGEMVFRYYDVDNANPAGNYQCAVVAGLTGVNGPCWFNCTGCVTGAGRMQTIANMITMYPDMAELALNREQPDLSGEYKNYALSEDDLVAEIDAGRPVIAGISPGNTRRYLGGSEHVALVIGYEDDDDDFYLIVNDPFPFEYVGTPNPYLLNGGEWLRSGRYRISYDSFVSDLDWAESIDFIDEY